MGTKKWPTENYYHKFINKSGGITNAFTMEESTTYYFQVLNNYFYKAVDIFASFFIEPLLSEDAIERETKAVNSEFMKNYPIDIVKIMSILKEIIDIEEHPFYNFGTGNTSTLAKSNIRNILKDFYDKYYSSNIMKLVILSNDCIANIEKNIREIFEKVPNKNVNIPKPCFNS